MSDREATAGGFGPETTSSHTATTTTTTTTTATTTAAAAQDDQSNYFVFKEEHGFHTADDHENTFDAAAKSKTVTSAACLQAQSSTASRVESTVSVTETLLSMQTSSSMSSNSSKANDNSSSSGGDARPSGNGAGDQAVAEPGKQASSQSSVLNSVFEHFRKFNEKFDNLNTQKDELEELKEKIMKLEQRNSELEKKLSSAANQGAGSKENSFNNTIPGESFDESFKNTTNNESQQQQQQQQQSQANGGSKNSTNVIISSNNLSSSSVTNNVSQQASLNNFQTHMASSLIIQNNSTNNLVFHNKVNLMQTNINPAQPASNMNTSATSTTSNAAANINLVGLPAHQPAQMAPGLNTIPNINQGGFIITSSGGIAFVPPMSTMPAAPKPAELSLSSFGIKAQPAPPGASFVNLISTADGSVVDDPTKLEAVDAASKAASNLDLFLSKGVFGTPNGNNSSSFNSPTRPPIGQQQQQQSSPNSILAQQQSQSPSKPANLIQLPLSAVQMAPAGVAPVLQTTAPATSNQTAFILSANGQLVPVITNVANPAPSTTAASVSPPTKSHQLILPAAPTGNPHILPKPILPAVSTTAPTLTTPINARSKKPIKPKTTNKKGTTPNSEKATPTLAASSTTGDVSTLLIPANASLSVSQVGTPTVVNSSSCLNGVVQQTTSTPISIGGNLASLATKKVREIRPKPCAIAPASAVAAAVTSASVKTPTPTTTANKSQNSTLAGFGLGGFGPSVITQSAATSIITDTNDILSKAASILFSPSEFNLNNLSPNTNTGAALAVHTPAGLISPSQASLADPNGQQPQQVLILNGGSLLTTATTAAAASPAKLPISRSNSSKALASLQKSPSNVDKTAKGKKAVKGESKGATTIKKALAPAPVIAPAAAEPTKANKIALPALNKPSQKKIAPAIQPQPTVTIQAAQPLVQAPATILIDSSATGLLDLQQSIANICSDFESTYGAGVGGGGGGGNQIFNSIQPVTLGLADKQPQFVFDPSSMQFHVQYPSNQVFATSGLADATCTVATVLSAGEVDAAKSANAKSDEELKNVELIMNMEQFFGLDAGSMSQLESEAAGRETVVEASVPAKEVKAKKQSKAEGGKSKTESSPQKPVKKIKEIMKKPDAAETSCEKIATAVKAGKKASAVKETKTGKKKAAKSDQSTGNIEIVIDNAATASSKEHGVDSSDKIKFEYSDLDKVLDQVESIAGQTGGVIIEVKGEHGVSAVMDANNSASDFIFDLLNGGDTATQHETSTQHKATSGDLSTSLFSSSNEDEDVFSGARSGVDSAKKSKKQKKTHTELGGAGGPGRKPKNKTGSLETPQAFAASKKKTSSTPVKAVKAADAEEIDDDFLKTLIENDPEQHFGLKIEFTDAELRQRTPLKPDNHQQQPPTASPTKKRGRPPKQPQPTIGASAGEDTTKSGGKPAKAAKQSAVPKPTTTTTTHLNESMNIDENEFERKEDDVAKTAAAVAASDPLKQVKKPRGRPPKRPTVAATTTETSSVAESNKRKAAENSSSSFHVETSFFGAEAAILLGNNDDEESSKIAELLFEHGLNVHIEPKKEGGIVSSSGGGAKSQDQLGAFEYIYDIGPTESKSTATAGRENESSEEQPIAIDLNQLMDTSNIEKESDVLSKSDYKHHQAHQSMIEDENTITIESLARTKLQPSGKAAGKKGKATATAKASKVAEVKAGRGQQETAAVFLLTSTRKTNNSKSSEITSLEIVDSLEKKKTSTTNTTSKSMKRKSGEGTIYDQVKSKQRRKTSSRANDSDSSDSDAESSDSDFVDEEPKRAASVVQVQSSPAKEPATIAHLVDGCLKDTSGPAAGEKRKRGRPPKSAAPAPKTAVAAVANPVVSTPSVAATAQAASGVEYAGLTRFEIPYELNEEETAPVQQSATVRDDQSYYEHKAPHDESIKSETEAKETNKADRSADKYSLDAISLQHEHSGHRANELDVSEHQELQQAGDMSGHCQTVQSSQDAAAAAATAQHMSGYGYNDDDDDDDHLMSEQRKSSGGRKDELDDAYGQFNQEGHMGLDGHDGEHSSFTATATTENKPKEKPPSTVHHRSQYDVSSYDYSASELVQSSSQAAVGSSSSSEQQQQQQQYWPNKGADSYPHLLAAESTPSASSNINSATSAGSSSSHYDLENDPIVNNDLLNSGQMHSSHLNSLKASASALNMVLTPPSSSALSNASSKHMSMNPSSTSSTTSNSSSSSAQMISPVSLGSGITSLLNDASYNSAGNNNNNNIAASANSYYQSNNNSQGGMNGMNRSYSSTTPTPYMAQPQQNGYGNDSSGLNIGQMMTRNNSSPQLIQPVANATGHPYARSHSVAPAPLPAQSPLNGTMQGGGHSMNSTATTPVPTPTSTPTPGGQASTSFGQAAATAASYGHNTTPPLSSSTSASNLNHASRSKSSSLVSLNAKDESNSNDYSQSRSYGQQQQQPTAIHHYNQQTQMQHHQHHQQSSSSQRFHGGNEYSMSSAGGHVGNGLSASNSFDSAAHLASQQSKSSHQLSYHNQQQQQQQQQSAYSQGYSNAAATNSFLPNLNVPFGLGGGATSTSHVNSLNETFSAMTQHLNSHLSNAGNASSSSHLMGGNAAISGASESKSKSKSKKQPAATSSSSKISKTKSGLPAPVSQPPSVSFNPLDTASVSVDPNKYDPMLMASRAAAFQTATWHDFATQYSLPKPPGVADPFGSMTASSSKNQSTSGGSSNAGHQGVNGSSNMARNDRSYGSSSSNSSMQNGGQQHAPRTGLPGSISMQHNLSSPFGAASQINPLITNSFNPFFNPTHSALTGSSNPGGHVARLSGSSGPQSQGHQLGFPQQPSYETAPSANYLKASTAASLPQQQQQQQQTSGSYSSHNQRMAASNHVSGNYLHQQQQQQQQQSLQQQQQQQQTSHQLIHHGGNGQAQYHQSQQANLPNYPLAAAAVAAAAYNSQYNQYAGHLGHAHHLSHGAPGAASNLFSNVPQFNWPL